MKNTFLESAIVKGDKELGGNGDRVSYKGTQYIFGNRAKEYAVANTNLDNIPLYVKSGGVIVDHKVPNVGVRNYAGDIVALSFNLDWYKFSYAPDAVVVDVCFMLQKDSHEKYPQKHDGTAFVPVEYLDRVEA